MDFLQFIDPALLIVIPVLWIIGEIIKDATQVDHKHIPLILGLCGVLLAILWLLATSDLAGGQSIVLAVFTAFVQGVLCAGAAVYGHQILKQYKGD